jgi:tetratricopeptide (TPR) repeat protein
MATAEPAAHALMGYLHDLCGRIEGALASYRAALYLDPAFFQVRVLLADCLLRLGNRDRAEHQYREVLTLLASGRESRWRCSRGCRCRIGNGLSGGAGRC